MRECVVLMCVRCSSRELNLSESNIYPAFYSSRQRQLQNALYDPIGGPKEVGSYTVMDYRLEVANNIFNGCRDCPVSSSYHVMFMRGMAACCRAA
jgi:hypothetical protein